MRLYPRIRCLIVSWLWLLAGLPPASAADSDEETRRLLSEADRAYAAGEYQAALQAIDEGLKATPDSPRLLTMRGITLAAMGKPEPAIIDLSRALELAPDLGDSRLARGWARIDANDLGGALADFEAILHQIPRCPPALAGRAWVRLVQQDFESAILDATTALESGERATSDNMTRAIELLQQTDLATAIRQAWSTTDLFDASPAAFEVRARARAAQEHHAEALGDFDQAIQRRPRRVTLWIGRARSRFALGRADEALADAEQACQLAPGGVDAHAIAILIATPLRDAEAVRKHARALVALDPGRADEIVAAAHALITVGALEEARAALKLAFAANPSHLAATRALFNLELIALDHAAAEAVIARAATAGVPAAEIGVMRAQLLRARGDPTGAMRELKAVLASDPRHLEARLTRKEIKLARGDFLGADQELERAIEVFPQSIDLLIERADLQLASIDDRLARELADRARAIDPNHPRVLHFDSYLALCDGDWARAIDCCQRARRLAPTSMQFILATALLESGDSAGAAAVLDEPRIDKTTDAYLDALRACTHIATGRVNEAIPLLERVVASKDESLADYRLDLALCQWHLGHAEAAAATLRAGGPEMNLIELSWLRRIEGRTMPIWDDPALSREERLGLSEFERAMDSLVRIALRVDVPKSFRGSIYLPGRRVREGDSTTDPALLLACVEMEKDGPPEKLRQLLGVIVTNTTATRASHHLAALWLARLPATP